MFPEAEVRSADDLRVGLVAEAEREITEADVLGFAAGSGDFNPLHVDPSYAAETQFGRPIVHGAFQVGLMSALIGMQLPGRNVLLGAINARFPAPLYYPCRVRVRGEITAWDRASRAGRLKVTVMEEVRRTPTAEIAVGFTLHEPGRPAVAPAPVDEPAASDTGSRKVILVTGASGGIGDELVRRLASDYAVLALTRQPLGERFGPSSAVRELRADLAAPLWEDSVRSALAGRPLYAVVHAAWPGAPRGGLLRAQDEVVEQQVVFASAHTVRLARLLFETVGEEGGRFVAISSIVGTMKPQITLGAYSLGKAVLECTLKLLAPELARKQVTINAVCPAFVPVGINANASDHQQKLEATRIPLGRLCTPADVVGAVAYLLSPEAGFLSAQLIGLTGGQI